MAVDARVVEHRADVRRRGPSRKPAARLGEALVATRLLTSGDLDWALGVQRRTGSPLGRILVASGLVSRLSLYRVLARQWGVPFVDLTSVPLDPALVEGLDVSDLATGLWVPISWSPDDGYLVASAKAPTEELLGALERRLGAPVSIAATTEWDVDYALRTLFRPQLLDEASHGLWRRNAAHSARVVLTAPQRATFLAVVLALVGASVLSARETLVVCCALVAVVFLVSVLFKFVVCLVGAYHENVVEVDDEDVDALGDEELPVYTVLVPCYHEAAVVGQLMANLGALDYPKDKLEILLLLEEDDDETREAALASKPPSTVRVVTVPRGDPQTKPKACNVGLLFARGELLVIYDAEDRPDPSQLKRAVVAFRKGGSDLVCVQAALNYFNAEENALTRLFTLEYSFWFDYMLPGLSALRLPIPLGGTSNHFRTDELRLLGGWDPFNVTEDADLGIRAAALGKRVGTISSTTFEEANKEVGNFVRQRSRWVKGYLQTTLVHLRHPLVLTRQVGWRQATAFALLIGGTPAAFLAFIPLYAVFFVSLALSPAELDAIFKGWALWISVASFSLGNVLMVYVSMMGVFKRRRHRLVLWALLNPFYWLLHSIAAYKALWQLVRRPYYWEKTTHGLTALSAAPAERS